MTRVLIILVKGHAPRHLLRRRIDLDRAPKLADRCQHLPSDLTDRSVGRERDTDHWPVAVLDDRFVRSQIKHHHERSEQSGASIGAVSQPRAVKRSAAC